MTLKQLIETQNLRGRRVFIRSDLNVPLDEQREITDDTRIRASLPAIQHCSQQGGAVMVCSHLGRPQEGSIDPRYTLAPVAACLSKLLNMRVPLIEHWLEKSFTVAAGEVVLLENARFLLGEKKNDPALAKQIAKLADIYVHDAFATAHRREATTYGIFEYAPLVCAGPLMVAEYQGLHAVLKNPERPLVAVIGGAKMTSKINALNGLIQHVDQLLVGGGVANTFLRSQSHTVGNSLVELEALGIAADLVNNLQQRKSNTPAFAPLLLPCDFVCADDAETTEVSVKTLSEITPRDCIFDIGPQTCDLFSRALRAAKTIIWSGPMGWFERDQFTTGTKSVATAISHTQAFSIAGGGDTLAALKKYALSTEFSYLSTGGGAFLAALSGSTLPAFAVLEARNNNREVFKK